MKRFAGSSRAITGKSPGESQIIIIIFKHCNIELSAVVEIDCRVALWARVVRVEIWIVVTGYLRGSLGGADQGGHRNILHHRLHLLLHLLHLLLLLHLTAEADRHDHLPSTGVGLAAAQS